MYGTLMEQKTAEIYDIFAPVEGYNYVYYGKVRNGKTYTAVADIITLLEQGEVVYANFKVNFEGYDERQSFRIMFLKFIFGKRYVYHFKKENFHYIDTNSPDLISHLNKLVGVHLFIDEGQWIFNSHLKNDDPEKRRLILEGGHYCRSLNVITQRPINILKDIRSQINIWYKIEKRIHWGSFIVFSKFSIEDMVDDVPNEDPELKPPVTNYIAREAIFNAYDTHGMRHKDAIELEPYFDVYTFTVKEHLLHLISLLPIPQKFKQWPTRVRRPSKEQKPLDKKNYKLSDIKRK